MTKEKWEIFTNVEAVTHWLEASKPAERGREENTADWIDHNSAVATQSYVPRVPSPGLTAGQWWTYEPRRSPKGSARFQPMNRQTSWWPTQLGPVR